MIAIIDNDVILKLARWDLIDDLLDLVAGECEAICHLPTCYHSLCGRPSRRAKTGCDAATVARIQAFCGKTNPIDGPFDIEILEILTGIPGIDSGEVQIFTIGTTSPDSLTYMADKRSLLALATTPTTKTIADRLAGRVKCLEQVMGELILTAGHAEVGNKVIGANPIADTAITIAFGTKIGLRQEAETWYALASYYQDLRKKTGELLAAFPAIPISL